MGPRSANQWWGWIGGPRIAAEHGQDEIGDDQRDADGQEHLGQLTAAHPVEQDPLREEADEPD